MMTRVMSYIRDNPGCTPDEIREGANVGARAITHLVGISSKRAGKVHRHAPGGGRPNRYYPVHAGWNAEHMAANALEKDRTL